MNARAREVARFHRGSAERHHASIGVALGAMMLIVSALGGCGREEQAPPAPEPAPRPTLEVSQAEAIAREAYVYGFPLVMNYKTLHSYALDESSPEYKGPFNEVSCEARLFTPEDKAIVTPNADTPYCMFWLDLRAEPQVLRVPEMEPDRFYHFQLIDLYTHNFEYVGTLTTGNGPGRFLLAGPDWKGEAPPGIDAVKRSETDFVFVVVRTQLFDPDDLARVEEIQAAYDLEPLSAFLGIRPPPAPPTPDWPDWEEGSQFDLRFFSILDFMLGLLEEPPAHEQGLWDRMARLGLGPGSDRRLSDMPAEIQEAMRAGARAGLEEIEAFIAEVSRDPLASGKLFGTRAFLEESAAENYGYEDVHLLRAAAAHIGLYGNSAQEAIYPSYIVDAQGGPYDASTHGYTLTFEKGGLPPVRAFWSLTMYDAKTQLFVPNALGRYLLNSTMTDQFEMDADGSLTLYIASESPGEARESNWLPAPDGPFYMVLRLYGPKEEALEGRWTPPAPHEVEKGGLTAAEQGEGR